MVVVPGIVLGGVGLIQGFPSYTSTRLNAIGSEVAFFVTVGANPWWFISAYGGKYSHSTTRLSGPSPSHGILLLETVKNCVGSKGGGVHQRVDQRLEVFKLIAKAIEEKNDFDLVKINQAHIHDLIVHD